MNDLLFKIRKMLDRVDSVELIKSLSFIFLIIATSLLFIMGVVLLVITN